QPGRRVKATLDGRVALACRAHKAAEREPVQRVLGAVALKQRQHARRIADAELLNLDFEQPRNKKVPQLVEEDEGADDENEGQNCQPCAQADCHYGKAFPAYTTTCQRTCVLASSIQTVSITG